MTVNIVWLSKSNKYIRKIHLITEEYDGETLSNNKENNLIVDEYDGEILTNDKVSRSQHCNLTPMKKHLQMSMAKIKL